MTVLPAFLISFVIGYLMLKILKDGPWRTLDFFLIPGLGLGISSQIVFYSLLALNRIDPVVIIGIHLLLLITLFFYSRRFIKQAEQNLLNVRQLGVGATLLILAGFLSALWVMMRPYGDWDAWAYWNYHANFLFRAGYHWSRVFESGMQGHHPWMLPCIVVWGWSFSGHENSAVPIAVSMVFTLSCLGLLVYALKEHIPFYWAVLAGVFLSSVPIYTKHGTSQYADILLAYFILAVCVLILDLIKTFSLKNAFLAGLFLGFAACSKDNGIMAAIILFIIIIMQLRRDSGKAMIRPFVWGSVTILVSIMIMKSFEALNVSNHAYAVSWLALGNIQRWILIGRFFWGSFFDHGWGMLWPILYLTVLFLQKKWRKEEGIKLILKFILVYIIFYLFIYAVSVLELKWLLEVSFDRLLYLLAPAAVFVTFYILGKEKHNEHPV